MESPIRSSRSRSPSIGVVSGSKRLDRRKVTVIDGAFQSQTDLDRSQTPPPSSHLSVSSRSSYDSDNENTQRARAMTSPPGDSPQRNGLSYSMTHLDNIVRPSSPTLSWRSSTSSLADTSVSSLIHQPSSEQKILKDIRKQMTETFLHAGHLEKEVNQIPKLRNDLDALYKEREKLLNELLEQKAVVLQLKQRIILLHEQNQELAKLAKSESSSNSQVLAIRNTLVATLAQLKQMEDQIQTIPTLKCQIRELEEEKKQLLSRQVVTSTSDIPEGVDSYHYQMIINENVKLKQANSHLLEEMKVVSKHLSGITESCEGLQSRMEMFQNSQNITQSLQERIKKLESEKDAIYQELVDAKYSHRNSVDVDTAHLKKEAKSLKKSNSRLKNRIEHMKIEARQQKEQLVIKLFEIESLNVKTSKYEIEKQMLEMEQLQVLSESGASEEMYNISSDGRAMMLRFQQLEVHSQEMQNVIKTFIIERQEMESRIAELTARINQSDTEELENKLEESESKLAIARERIKSLEMKKSASPEVQLSEGERDSFKQQISEMETELRRLSAIERRSIFKGSQTDELLETKEKLAKAKSEKEKLGRKFKEGRSRLKSLASELAGSAELIKKYQVQCSNMENDLKICKTNLEQTRNELFEMKAKLEVNDVELKLHDPSVVTELQSKVDELNEALSKAHNDKVAELAKSEMEIKKLQEEIAFAKEENNTNQSTILQLKSQVKEFELVQKELEKLRHDHNTLTKSLTEKTKKNTELEFSNNEMQSLHETLQKEIKTLENEKEGLKNELSALQSKNESLKQKVDILSKEAPNLVQQSAEMKVARDTAERNLELALAEQANLLSRAKTAESKLESSDKLVKELKKKLHLLQSDLDEAESFTDEIKKLSNEMKLGNESLRKEMESLKRAKEEEISKLLQRIENETKKAKDLEEELNTISKKLEEEKCQNVLLENDISRLRTEEIPKLHSELAKTVSEMGQLTTDYSSRVARIRELESFNTQSKAENDSLSQKLLAVEKELSATKAKNVSVTSENKSISEKLKELQSTHSMSVTHNQKINEELKKVKGNLEKKMKELNSTKEECASLKEKQKINQHRMAELDNSLKRLSKEKTTLSGKVTELESVSGRCKDLENQCEMLTATRDNLLHRLDRMEKLEMDYELLKHRVQDVIGQSSQLKNDNKALLQLLEDVETEMPALEKQVTRNLQEENLELHQQVSLLSQWNDKHQQSIASLEQQIESMEDEKKQILDELVKAQSFEQESKLLKKELGEVEIEVNRLKRHAHEEVEEEMKMKMETQAQLLSIFNEHNKGLQIQVAELIKQIKESGGRLIRDRPISPPPIPELSDTLKYASTDARRCSELEIQNASLQQQIGQLQAELLVAQDISPIIRRRSSTLLAVSSVPPASTKENSFISVPEEMLLACSMIADGFINQHEISEDLLDSYLKTIGECWFSAISQKSIIDTCIQSYVTTFSRLSSKLLKIIVNLQDLRGNSALHHLLANSNFSSVSVLLDLECCNTNITNKAGYTPLMLTAAHNIDFIDNKSVIQKLLSRTDVNIVSKVQLQTALMLAASSGALELVTMLLEFGADINAQDKDGSTSLMFACEKGYIEIVQKLLSNLMCKISLKDNDDQNAYDIAHSTGHNDICMLLKKYQATRKQ